jgi:mono/diheme cytochrome c family protein
LILSMKALLKGLVLVLPAVLLFSPLAIASAGDIKQGRAIYQERCASCHGLNADGHGPVAPALSTPPTNLRPLSERYGNPLPADQIARFIDGRADVKAHGPRDMPVWGEDAWNSDGKRSTGRTSAWVKKVIAYLQSIQNATQQASLEQGPVAP